MRNISVFAGADSRPAARRLHEALKPWAPRLAFLTTAMVAAMVAKRYHFLAMLKESIGVACLPSLVGGLVGQLCCLKRSALKARPLCSIAPALNLTAGLLSPRPSNAAAILKTDRPFANQVASHNRFGSSLNCW